MGKEPVHGGRALCQDLRADRLRQYWRLVAERALALKMKVIAYDPFFSAERAVKLGVEKVELDDLAVAGGCDFIAHAIDGQDQEHRVGGSTDEPRKA